jgi:hypothetical protein
LYNTDTGGRVESPIYFHRFDFMNKVHPRISTEYFSMPSTSTSNSGKVFLAQQLASQNPLPSFTERGIGDLQPSGANDVPIVIVNKSFNYGVASVLQFLTAFAVAQLTNTASIASMVFYNVFRSIAVQYWIQTPTAIFQFPNVTDELSARLRSFGLQIDTGRKNCFSGSPTFDHLKEIHSLGPSEGRFTPGYASIQAYTAWMFLQKAMMVYSYLSHAGNNLSGPVAHASWGLPVAKVTGGEIALDYLGSKGTVVLKDADGKLEGHAMLGSAPVATPYDKTRSIHFAPLTRESTINTSGVMFPYFEGMNLPDKETIVHVFSQLFVSMLGKNAEESMTLWGIVRPGIRSLSTLRAGVSMSHAYTGIELSHKSSIPISFIIENGMYHGFVLHGDLEIRKYSSQFNSVSGEVLTGYLREIGNQEALIREFINIVQTPIDENGAPLYSTIPAIVRRSRSVYHLVQSLDKNQIGDTGMARIHTILEKLLYTDSFPGITQASIIDFLHFMHTGDETILDKYPAYLQSGYYRLTGRVYVGLSIFGSRAPTINYGRNGRSFTIPSEGAQDPNMAIQTDGKRLLHYLPFSVVPVREAATQWNKLFDSGSFMIPAGRKGKSEFTNTVEAKFKIGSEPGFTDAYQTIRDIVNSRRQTRAIGKRRRMNDDEEVDTRASKKGKKIGVTAAGLM